MKWIREAGLALKAVSIAGKMAADRPERATVKESFRDIVTEVDIVIERQIRGILSECGHPIIGEEESATTPVPTSAPYWLVDPIDGTANFLAGMPYFACSVGLAHGDDFVAGAVALPALRELFFTHGDGGAFLNGGALHVRDASMSESLIAGGFSGVKGDEEQRKRQFQLFGDINDSSRGCLRLGSAATNICYVAAGRLQASYGHKLQLWDVAAGLAIAHQAGAKVWTRREPNSTRIDFAVGAPSVVARILELMELYA